MKSFEVKASMLLSCILARCIRLITFICMNIVNLTMLSCYMIENVMLSKYVVPTSKSLLRPLFSLFNAD